MCLISFFKRRREKKFLCAREVFLSWAQNNSHWLADKFHLSSALFIFAAFIGGVFALDPK